MARLNLSVAAGQPADDGTCSRIDLEQKTRDAIREHRRLASAADDAYAAWEEASHTLQTSDEVLIEVRYRYVRAMMALRQQQDELNGMINRLGYIPKSVA